MKVMDLQPIKNERQPIVTGTFVQSWLCNSWDDARWDRELNDMKTVGITSLILGDVATKDRMKNGGKWFTYYPSALPALTGDNLNACYGDMVEKALKKCREHAVGVFLGLGGYADWDYRGGIGKSYLDFCAVSAEIAGELYDRYYSRYTTVIKGWYFVPEINNLRLCTLYPNKIAKGVNQILDKLTTLNPALPLLISPYHTKYFGAAGLKQTKKFWQTLFAQIHFRKGDIFSPQDAVGAGWIELSDLEARMRMYQDVMVQADKGVRFWANCENFSQSHIGGLFRPKKTENTAFIPAPLNRFVKQLHIVSPFVENCITFSFNHYCSPAQIGDRVYYDTYRDYVEHQRVKVQKPAPPETIQVNRTPEGHLHIHWDAGKDSIGIAGYRVYKNGRFLVRRDVSVSLADPIKYPLYDYTDTAFDNKKESLYEVECFDAAGNVSNKRAHLTK